MPQVYKTLTLADKVTVINDVKNVLKEKIQIAKDYSGNYVVDNFNKPKREYFEQC